MPPRLEKPGSADYVSSTLEPATEINARGSVKSLSYRSTSGELAGMVYADEAAPAQTFTYTLTGRLASVTDAAGSRAFSYNEYDELVSDCLTADEIPHLITENRDGFGRSTGFAYSKAGSPASAEQYGYGTDGRLSSAAFMHGNAWNGFQYAYLPGTHLLHTLTMPNGMTLMQQYEVQRDLLTGMFYKRGETSVVERFYSYDALGRPLTRQQNRQGGTRQDAFVHNNRSELTAATYSSNGNTQSFAYAYDNIGNRKTAQENAEEATAYTANALNQYTAVGTFAPSYDADGNQTRVQTSTGIWNVTYNAENRPTQFTRSNADGSTTRITCTYDYMGRRATKKVETLNADATASTDLHQRYIYRDFLQIACCDLTRDNHPHLWFITWDPTQPVATRPLALRKDGTWYCYGWDLTKNICEVFSNEGYLNNTVTYSYTPYGAVTAEGNVQQPLQWSSEFYDGELGLVYYNYRHYNPENGRWIGRDSSQEGGGVNLYEFSYNNSISLWDVLGMAPSRSDIESAVQEARSLLAEVKKCKERKLPKCCTDMYNEYLSKLSKLQIDAGDFYESQWWISDEDSKVMSDVHELPIIVDGISMSSEQLSAWGDALNSARESIDNNLYVKYNEEIGNGADFVAGFSDGVLLGLPGIISEASGTPWPSTDSAWYTGGLVTGVAATSVTYGFGGLPRNMTHFTTEVGAQSILASGSINASKVGLWGPGTYMAQIGRPWNPFVPKASTTPITFARPSGTIRIIPKLVYLRPFRGVKLPK